jgi:hypothetical protein
MPLREHGAAPSSLIEISPQGQDVLKPGQDGTSRLGPASPNRELWLFLPFLSLAAMLQFLNGAWTAEFGLYSDEPAHYVTGLMVHDFLLKGNWLDPLSFAEQYYVHYPKVALGHWGPVFSLVQAGWELAFGAGRISLMLLMASVAALLASLIYRAARPESSRTAAFGVAACFIMLPLVQTLTASVMTELWSTLFIFLASLAFGRFLETVRYRDMLAFSGWASLAILTKGNGLLLALLPVFAIALARRPELFRRFRLWLSAILVAVICGPWFVLTLKMQRNGMAQESFSWEFVQEAAPFYSLAAVTSIGIGLFGCTILGFLRQVARPALHGGATGKWASLGGLMLAVGVFHLLVPCGWEARHLLIAVPPMLACAVVGLDLAALWLAGGHTQPLRMQLLTGLIATLLFVAIINRPDAACGGFTRVVQDLEARPELRDSVLLISADEIGDGMFVATVAQRDQRPNRIVFRASKVLSSSRWDGRGYQSLFSTPEDLQAWLESIPVGVVVLDRTLDAAQYPEYRLLEATLAKFGERWDALGTYPAWRSQRLTPRAIAVYRLRGHEGRPRGKIAIGLGDKLGKSLELKP